MVAVALPRLICGVHLHNNLGSAQYPARVGGIKLPAHNLPYVIFHTLFINRIAGVHIYPPVVIGENAGVAGNKLRAVGQNKAAKQGERSERVIPHIKRAIP